MIAATNFLDMIGMVSTDKKNNGLINRPSQTTNSDFKSFIDRAKNETRQSKPLEKTASKDYKTEKDQRDLKGNSLVKENNEPAKVETNKVEKKNKVDAKDNDSKDLKNIDKEDEKVLNEVAEKLDVDVKTLVNFLQTLNVDIDSISEISLSSSEIASKISDFVNSIVDGEELSSINKGFAKAMNTKNASMDTKLSMMSKELSKLMDPVKNDSEITVELKQQLEALNTKNTDIDMNKQNNASTNNIQENYSNVQNVSEVKSDKKDDKNVEVKEASNDSISKTEKKQHPIVKPFEKDEQVPNQVTKQDDAKANNSKQNDKTQHAEGVSNLISKIKTVEVKQSANTSIDEVHNNVLPAQQFESLMNKVETLKSALQPANTQKADIFDQVLENAKLVLSDKQTEMELNLKPESLGKLNLKIATENGMVMAKITTESQQVKQIIESNMIQLKEALNQQGLNIQQFSVSVGDNSKREMFNGHRFGSSKQNKVNHNTVNTVSASESYVSRIMARNPYLVSESSFDYTA